MMVFITFFGFIFAKSLVSMNFLEGFCIFAVYFAEGTLGDSFGTQFFLDVIFSLLFFTFFIILDCS